MEARALSATIEKEVLLANEFAEVKVEVDHAANRLRLKITDLGTGLTACLDPVAAFPEKGVTSTNELAEVGIEVDRAANGPRLKITHLSSGQEIYLDPLELSDAAVSGVWGRFPEVYNV